MPTLAELPDSSHCRVLTPSPVLDEAGGAALITAFDKILAQFAREDRMTTWGTAVEHRGAAFVIAWTPDVALSGCSHDKINRMLQHYEMRLSLQLVTPPPLVIQIDGIWRCTDRAGLRAHATATTPLIDARIEQLGAWRTRGLTTVGASWAAGLLSPRSNPVVPA
ncbi:MAG: hypothetical protein AAB263_20955 [Planctomycetota bacterium]